MLLQEQPSNDYRLRNGKLQRLWYIPTGLGNMPREEWRDVETEE